jgi:hypothetical protein
MSSVVLASGRAKIIENTSFYKVFHVFMPRRAYVRSRYTFLKIIENVRFYKLFDDVEVPVWVVCRALCWQAGVPKSLKMQAFTRFFMFSCLAVLVFVRDKIFKNH